MGDCRFENWTRIAAGKSDRRAMVVDLAYGTAALLTLAPNRVSHGKATSRPSARWDAASEARPM